MPIPASARRCAPRAPRSPWAPRRRRRARRFVVWSPSEHPSAFRAFRLARAPEAQRPRPIRSRAPRPSTIPPGPDPSPDPTPAVRALSRPSPDFEIRDRRDEQKMVGLESIRCSNIVVFGKARKIVGGEGSKRPFEVLSRPLEPLDKPPHPLKLGEVLDWTVSYADPPCVWLVTLRAWYRLGEPSAAYLRTFAPMHRRVNFVAVTAAALREDWNLTVEAALRALAEVPVVPGDLLDPRGEALASPPTTPREKRREKTPRPPPPPQAPTQTSCARRERRRRRSATRWRRFDTPSETSWRIAPSSGGTSTRFDSPARWRPAMRSPPRPSRARSRRFSRRRSVARRSRRRSRARTRSARRIGRRRASGSGRRARRPRDLRVGPRRRAPSRSNLASRDSPPPPRSPILSSRSPTAPLPRSWRRPSRCGI